MPGRPSPEQEFNPINPLDLADQQLSDYLKRFSQARYLEGITPKEYSGSADLLRLVQVRAIGIGTIIRIWQTELPEFNLLTHRGLLDLRNAEIGIVRVIPPPFSELDTNYNNRPYRWNIEDYQPFSNQGIDNFISSTG